MIKNNTQPLLLQKLFELLSAHRGAFEQERVYWRNVGMVVGEVFNFGRHTVTQMLLSLGGWKGIEAPGTGCSVMGAIEKNAWHR